MTALFDEFEEYRTPEAKYAHAMDNLQPLILNNSNNGSDWKEHGVFASQVYERQGKTQLGSQKLFEITDTIIKENIEKGNLLLKVKIKGANIMIFLKTCQYILLFYYII